jgi:signal transduction histidine kinase
LATASRIRAWSPELAWVGFVAANLGAVVLVPSGETVPFHWVWLSLTLIYGYRLWSFRATMVVLGAVSLASGGALTIALMLDGQGLDETAEIPMMASLFLAMVWHATRRQAALEEVRQATDRERDFVRNASHQLRTPITVARGHAELILEEAGDPQIGDDAGVVLEELDRLARIADGLLILATAEHVGLDRAPVNVAGLAEVAARRWRPTAERDWKLQIRAHGTLLGDEERIEAAIDALIENALKATDSGDRIEIAVSAELGVAVIAVSDDGRGIGAEDLGRVFDRFYRATGQGARTNGGTGLGLAIVKAIAEAHGGSADAANRPGGGTTFRIRLPGFTHTLWPATELLSRESAR